MIADILMKPLGTYWVLTIATWKAWAWRSNSDWPKWTVLGDWPNVTKSGYGSAGRSVTKSGRIPSHCLVNATIDESHPPSYRPPARVYINLSQIPANLLSLSLLLSLAELVRELSPHPGGGASALRTVKSPTPVGLGGGAPALPPNSHPGLVPLSYLIGWPTVRTASCRWVT